MTEKIIIHIDTAEVQAAIDKAKAEIKQELAKMGRYEQAPRELIEALRETEISKHVPEEWRVL